MSDRRIGGSEPDRSLSHHILPSAATMVGICPTLIGLVKLTETDGIVRQADELLGIIGLVPSRAVFTRWCEGYGAGAFFGSRGSSSGRRVARRLGWTT